MLKFPSGGFVHHCFIHHPASPDIVFCKYRGKSGWQTPLLYCAAVDKTLFRYKKSRAVSVATIFLSPKSELNSPWFMIISENLQSVGFLLRQTVTIGCSVPLLLQWRSRSKSCRPQTDGWRSGLVFLTTNCRHGPSPSLYNLTCVKISDGTANSSSNFIPLFS